MYISMQFVMKCQNKRQFDQKETSAGKFVMQFILRSKKKRRVLQLTKTPTMSQLVQSNIYYANLIS